MELQEFVKETLSQISQGVKDAQDSVRDTGGYVNPAVTYAQGKPELIYFGETAQGHHTFLVDFDVAVTVAEKNAAEGGAKLAVASLFSVGGSGSSNAENTTTSRVKFKVPLALPFDQQSMTEIQQKREKSQRELRNSLNQQKRGPMSF